MPPITQLGLKFHYILTTRGLHSAQKVLKALLVFRE
jgi:hypothetical protein